MPKNKPSRFKMNACDIYLPLKNQKTPCLKTWFPREAVDTSSERCYLEQIKQKRKSLVLMAPYVGLTSTFKCFCTSQWGAFTLCCPGLRTWAHVGGSSSAALLPRAPAFACSTSKWRSLGGSLTLACSGVFGDWFWRTKLQTGTF